MKDFDEILIKLQDEVETREMEEEVRKALETTLTDTRDNYVKRIVIDIIIFPLDFFAYKYV